jgi:membrane protease YdiL (CAAX protease family)
MKRFPPLVLLIVLLPTAATSVVCWLIPEARTYDNASLVYALANWLGLALLLALFVSFGVNLDTLGAALPSLKHIPVAVLAAVVGIFVIYPLTAWLVAYLGIPMRRMEISFAPGHESLAITVFYAVLTAPLAEEILYRGLAMGYLLARGYSLGIVLFVPQVLFAAIHIPRFGLGVALFIAVWGLLPASLRLWYGYLGPSWLMHVLNNAVVYVALGLLFNGDATAEQGAAADRPSYSGSTSRQRTGAAAEL